MIAIGSPWRGRGLTEQLLHRMTRLLAALLQLAGVCRRRGRLKVLGKD